MDTIREAFARPHGDRRRERLQVILMSGTGLLVAFILKWPVPQAADFERVPRFVLCYLEAQKALDCRNGVLIGRCD